MPSTRQHVAERTKTPAIHRSRDAATAVARVGAVVSAGSISRSALRVSSPSDPAEREAESVARKVVSMPEPAARAVGPAAPGSPASGPRSPYAARFAGNIVSREVALHRKGEGGGIVPGNVASEIDASRSGGSPLPPSVRRFMEPRFGANFDGVRIHTGDQAAGLSRRLNAKAFTVGNNVFFGRGQFQPESGEGRELIAHELTHTIQQGSAVQRSVDVTVSERSPTQAQRLGVSDALDYFADKALNIPGFRMFTIVLGVNPINMSGVDRSPANIMRAVVEFLPGGHQITQALDNHGVFDKVAAWAAGKIAALGMVGSAFKTAVDQFLDSLSWSDILRLGDVWERAKRIFTEPIDKLIEFVKSLAVEILGFIKDAIVMPLARLAQNTRGYDLLRAVLGEDPISGEKVPQTADNLVGGFMKFIGEDEIWENVKKANAIPRVFAWFKGAMGAVMGFVSQLPTLFLNALKALEIADLILVPRAFAKLVGVFGDFAVKFVTWAGTAIWNLLEIVFDVVSPAALGYIKRTGSALKSILKNPLPFVGNLVKAAKLGIGNFGKNFLEHLKAGLIEWLTGSLPGIYIPKAFTLGEIVKFALSVLGLTWQNIRSKLVKAVGETAVKAMETGFDIVVTLVKEGPAAAWEKIKEQLTNLKEMIIDGITDMVVDMVVQKAIPKLVSMFIPGAGFISAILSIYDTIMVLVQKLSRIVQVVTSFLDSIVAIASGAIASAAARLESVLSGLLSLAISTLAGIAGLGKAAAWVMKVFEKARAPFDKAFDAVVGWIVTTAKKLFSKVLGSPDEKLKKAMEAAKGAVARFAGKKVGEAILKPLLFGIKTAYGLKSLDVVAKNGRWTIRGVINPADEAETDVQTEDGEQGEISEQELMELMIHIVDPSQAGMVDSDEDDPDNTRPVGPEVTISVTSLELSEEILYYYVDASPATAARKASVSRGVAAKIAAARGSRDHHDIYKALQQAGGMVNSLYPGGNIVQVHHEQAVGDHPETFPKTQEERVRTPKNKQFKEQMDKAVKAIYLKYKKDKNTKPKDKRAAAEKDIKELAELIKKSLLDWKLTREKDAKGKRTKKGAQATAGAVPLDEIDLIAGSRRAHVTVHQQRRKS